jgi:hypothetical protein
MAAVRRQDGDRQKEGIGEQKDKTAVGMCRGKKKKTSCSKQVNDLPHSFSSNRHKFCIKIVNFLSPLPFPCPSVSESLIPLNNRLNWIVASGLVTDAGERGVFVDQTLWSLY